MISIWRQKGRELCKLHADGWVQNIDAELSSVGTEAETRMKLDFQLFKGASIRFNDLENAGALAADLLANTDNAVKASRSFFLSPPNSLYPF